MASRESVPNAAALEQIEAPSREVAEAKRRAAEADAADKPALKDAIDTLRRLEGDDGRVIGIPGLQPMLDGGDPGERDDSSNGRRGPRGTLKGPGPGRVEQQTSPSLARVLAGEEQSSADELVEEGGEAIADEGQGAPAQLPKIRPVVVAGFVAVALALILGMLAIALWGTDDKSPTQTGAPTTGAATTTPTAEQTVPVTATAPATVEPPATSAVTADPVRSSGSTRPSSKASSKATETVQAPVATTARSSAPPPASSLPPGWNPNI